jgi:hypothetical protein
MPANISPLEKSAFSRILRGQARAYTRGETADGNLIG